MDKFKNNVIVIVLIIILLSTNVSNVFADDRPNIIFILTDDQRANTIQKYMPTVYKQIFLKGTQFTNAYATTPICGPSRISILTGLYATEHGMLYNGTQEKSSLNEYSIAKQLKNSGYYTGHVGKFHNTSDGKFSANRQQEYDYWVSLRGGSAHYLNSVVNDNGRFSNKKNSYITTFWNRKALDFIDVAAETNKPFFLTLSHNAPHSPALPDKEYQNKYNARDVKVAPSFLDTSDTGKADFVNKTKQRFLNIFYYNTKNKNIRTFAGKQLATLMSVDQGVKSIIKKLKAKKIYNNTVLIFMSDNGLMWGEHCLQSKNNTYQEATKIPLAISYKKDSTLFPIEKNNDVVANIDIASTLAELANIDEEEYKTSGVSLLKTIRGESDREGVLIQGSWKFEGKVYSAYHTKDYVYSETGHIKHPELYDLRSDPYELVNLASINDPEDPILLIKENLKNSLDDELSLHDLNACHSMVCKGKEFF